MIENGRTPFYEIWESSNPNKSTAHFCKKGDELLWDGTHPISKVGLWYDINHVLSPYIPGTTTPSTSSWSGSSNDEYGNPTPNGYSNYSDVGYYIHYNRFYWLKFTEAGYEHLSPAGGLMLNWVGMSTRVLPYGVVVAPYQPRVYLSTGADRWIVAWSEDHNWSGWYSGGARFCWTSIYAPDGITMLGVVDPEFCIYDPGIVKLGRDIYPTEPRLKLCYVKDGMELCTWTS